MAETIIRVPGKFKATELGTPLADTSDLYDNENNQGLNATLQEVPEKADQSDTYTKQEVNTALGGKQDTIADLSKIRSGAAAGATAFQMPSGGIPKTDLAADVQDSLNAANNAAPQANTYTKAEVNGLVSTPHENFVTVQATSLTTSATDVLPASGQSEDTIYRVGNWDGAYNSGAGQFDVTKYTEYAWNGTAYVMLAVKSQIGEVFDISAYNSTTYADLAAALGTNGANIPEPLRKGGMSVKFVQSSDNKYVQFRYMSSSTAVADFTNVANWQGVDEKPTARSNNLVKSGGVYDAIEPVKDYLFGNTKNYSLVGSSAVKEIPVSIRAGYNVTITATEWSEGLKAQIRYKDKGGNIHYLDGPNPGGYWKNQGDTGNFVATEDWTAVSILRSTTGNYNVSIAATIESNIKDNVVAGSDNLANSKGIYANISNTKFLIGGQLNSWNQGVPTSGNPYTVTANSIRICSLANIAYAGCKLRYEVPQGYKIIIVSWDGIDVTTYTESSWITGKGIHTLTNNVFNVVLGHTNDSAISPTTAPDLILYSFASEAENEKQYKSVIPLKAIQIDGTSVGNSLNVYKFNGAVKGKTYRLSLYQTSWSTPSLASYYAKFVFGYINNSGVETNFVVRTLEQSLEPYYDVVIPNDINSLGQLYVNIRGAQEEPLLFFINEIDTSNFGKRLVNSKIFKSCNVAWVDKDHQYESWPNGGVIADGDQIILIYNSSSAHVATDLVSDVMMRTKTTLGDWDEKKIILQHTASIGYGNPSCCMMPNGDYIVIASILTAETVSAQRMAIKIVKSSDKGETWSDVGSGTVQVNGSDVLDECMMDLFCTSTGKLIAFVGSTVNCKYIASDDGGETWRFVGDAISNCLEACFYERDNGEIISILRRNSSDPALIKLNAGLTEYEVLYTFGTFKFPAYYNPSSIIKLQNGELYLLGGSRRKDSDNHFLLYEAIVTEEELLANNFSSRVILKAKASNFMDWGYAQAVIAKDGTIYGYFYDSEGTLGTTQIYEMLGC